LCDLQRVAVEEGVEREAVLLVPAGRRRRRALRLQEAEHVEGPVQVLLQSVVATRALHVPLPDHPLLRH
jgi:hypothetical protein